MCIQTWKMSEILPEQDCSFPDFTQKCVNYVNFKTALFKCKYNVYSIYIFTSCLIRHNKSHRSVLGYGESSSSASWISRDGPSSLSLLVTRESTLLAMETKFQLGEDSGHGFTLILPYPAGGTLSKLGNFTQSW